MQEKEDDDEVADLDAAISSVLNSLTAVEGEGDEGMFRPIAIPDTVVKRVECDISPFFFAFFNHHIVHIVHILTLGQLRLLFPGHSFSRLVFPQRARRIPLIVQISLSSRFLLRYTLRV